MRKPVLGKKPAFTLIELLVVVSIIALLISILLPSLRRAREQAKAAACIANMKGIATSSLVYAEDDEQQNTIPVHPVVDDDAKPWQTRIRVPIFAYGGKSGRGRQDGNEWYWGTPLGRGPAARPMNSSMFKGGLTNYAPPPYGGYAQGDAMERWRADRELNLDVFRCPSDTGYTGLNYTALRDQGLTAFDFWGTSYVANAFWVQDGSWLYSCASMLRPVSRIPSPASTILYFEECAMFATDFEPQPDNGCGYATYTGRLMGWHKRDFFFNVSFADAHAETIKIKGFQAPMLIEYPGYLNQNEGHLMYRCVIYRGDGWQFDTLPSPLINTGIPYGG